MVLELLKKEVDICKLQANIGKQVEEKISKDQRRYFLQVPPPPPPPGSLMHTHHHLGLTWLMPRGCLEVDGSDQCPETRSLYVTVSAT